MSILENSRIDNSTIKEFSWIRDGCIIADSTIGNDVFIGFHCIIKNSYIGDNVQIASKSEIGEENGNKTIIEKGCWIGARAIIKAGITIGKGAVIGADTIVDKSVPPFSIVVGKPGHILKNRNCSYDHYPQFRNMFLAYHNLYSDMNGNKISADIISLGQYTIGEKNILIGKKAKGGGLLIEDKVTIGNGNILEGAGGIHLEQGCIIGDNIQIISNSHDYTKLSLPMALQPVKIGKNARIGDNSIILGNVSISEGQTIPANSLVLKSL